MNKSKRKKTKKEQIRSILVVSDLHCGSTVALLPPEFETIEGQAVKQNKVQKWLWECWLDATGPWLKSVIGDAPFALVINGDAIEGVHHGTTQVVSPDPADHRVAAEQVLAPLAERASLVVVVKGTEVHTLNSEVQMGHNLGASRHPSTGLTAADRWLIDCAGVRCGCRHHIGTSARAYLEASQLSIHLGNEQIEAARVGHPVPRVLGCAHRHRYGRYDDAHGLCFVSPPWQFLTRFGHKVVSAAVTKPGMVILDWRLKNDGELPDVKPCIYVPAPDQGVKI